MYWKAEEAIEELKNRQRDKQLRTKVNEFLKGCPIPAGSHGFLARHIASARLEDLDFEQRCQEVGLQPIFLEHPQDVFVSNNPSKMRLIRVYVWDGYGKNGGPRIRRIDLLRQRDIREVDGRVQLCQLSTRWGESIVAFHHRTRKVVGLKGEVLDVSPWLKSIGQAREYYKYFLAACLDRGILFESFESPGFLDLDIFKSRIVRPALEWAEKNFGCSPLIVKHPEVDSSLQEERILNWYHSLVLEAVPKEYRPSFG